MRTGTLALACLAIGAMARGDEVAKAGDAAQVSLQIDFTRDVVPFLSKHCYGCHGNGKSKGDLTLDRFRDEQSVEKERKVWENVIEMISAGEMPPKNRPRPAA